MNFESTVPHELALIEDVRAGQRASFDILVSHYQPKGLGIAYTLVSNIEDAKDILQEAFIKMYIHIKGFEGRSRFSTWFYRIVINCAFDFLRKRKRANKIFVEVESSDEDKKESVEVSDLRFEPAKAGMAKELAQKLEDAVNTLPKMQKACFVLRHQNSLSIQEIAEALKGNPATVRVHLFRAVGNLRKSLAAYLKTEGRL